MSTTSQGADPYLNRNFEAMSQLPDGAQVINGKNVYTIKKSPTKTNIYVSNKDSLKLSDEQAELFKMSPEELIDKSIEMAPDHHFTKSGLKTQFDQLNFTNPLTGEELPPGGVSQILTQVNKE